MRIQPYLNAIAEEKIAIFTAHPQKKFTKKSKKTHSRVDNLQKTYPFPSK